MLYMCTAQTVMLVQIGCYTAQNITKMILSTSKHKKHGTGGLIMARLIDADDFLKWLDVGHLRNPGEVCFCEADVANMIKSRATIDPVHAAGACYCRECKHWQEHYDYCKEFAEERNQGDFCSRGQRREGSQCEK